MSCIATSPSTCALVVSGSASQAARNSANSVSPPLVASPSGQPASMPVVSATKRGCSGLIENSTSIIRRHSAALLEVRPREALQLLDQAGYVGLHTGEAGDLFQRLLIHIERAVDL